MKDHSHDTKIEAGETATGEQHMSNDQLHVVPDKVEGPSLKKRKLNVTVKVEWEERVLELIQFKIRKGNTNVPVKWKPNTGMCPNFCLLLQ